MSSCISGGAGRAYRLETLDLELIKSPSSTSWISNSSSPSSTLSESTNSPLAISTRKPRTPRKRPNQTYNEAQALLSTAYPKLFPTSKHLININTPFLFEPSDLLNMPFRAVHNSGFLLLETPNSVKGFEKSCQSPGEINSQGITRANDDDDDDGDDKCQFNEDFDAESMLDEEIGEGIDSIMGNLEMENEQISNCCYGYPVGLGFGMKREIRAMRRDVEEGDWWSFPCVNVLDITPKINPDDKKKKKKGFKFINSVVQDKSNSQSETMKPDSDSQDSVPRQNAGLLLKLNYDDVLNAWPDKVSPFSGDAPPSDSAGTDVQARLAQIDLFSENGIREASVLRYKEKRRTRLFSKKIRYQVRKVNADRRPRMKGRFVRTPSTPEIE